MDEKSTDQIVKEALYKYNRGICIHCGAEIMAEKQVGRCVYATPCWDRIGQGRARTPEQLAEARELEVRKG